MKKKRYDWFVLIGSLIAVLLLSREYALLPDGNVHLYFLDIGQGDSTLIRTPGGKTILIDGGPDLTTLEHLGKHLPFFDRTIDMIILSHPHLDHIASLPSIVERYDVDYVLIPSIDYNLGIYQELLTQLRDGMVLPIIAEVGQRFDMGDDVQLEILWPPDGWYAANNRDDVNDVSVVGRLTWKDHTLLLTGDIGEEVETLILASGADVSADILKVAHHGSRYSSGTGFLVSVNPDLAIISAGKENRFNHPHPIINKRFEMLHIPHRRIDLEGTIAIEWE